MAKRKLKVGLDVDTAKAVGQAGKAKRSLRDVGKEGKKAGDDTTRSMKGAGGTMDKLGGSVRILIGAYAGFAGVRMVMASLRREMELIDATTKSALQSMRGVLSLGALKGRRKEEVEAMWKLAQFTGRPIEQVAGPYYALLGGTYGMAPERQRAIARQAGLWAKTDPTADMGSLVRMLATMGSQQPGLTPQQIGNIASYTIEAAQSTPTEMAGALPRVMATGQAVKAEPALPMALFSYISRQTGDPHLAATASTALMFGLAKTPPQILGQMKRFGFDPKAPMLEKLQWLGGRGADLPEEVAMALGGRRGIVALSSMAARPEEFMRGLEETRGALAAPGSLFGERLAGMYGEVPAQRMLDQMAKMDVLRQRQRVQPATLRRKMLMEFRTDLARRQGEGAPQVDFRRMMQSVSRYLGRGTSWLWEREARMEPSIGDMFDLLEAGYAPEDIVEIVEPELRERGPFNYGLDEMKTSLKAAGRRPMQEGGTIIQNPGVVHVHPAGAQGATPNPREANP